jgi:hypothetical protein
MFSKSTECPRLIECRAGYIGNMGHLPEEHKKKHPRNLQALPSRMFGDGRACWFLAGLLLTLKMEVTCFSPTLVDFYRTTQHYISGDRTPQFLPSCLFLVRPTLLKDICTCISKVSIRAYFDISHKEFQFLTC